MQQSANDNIILFPKWKSILEEESLKALKEKRYDEALAKLDQLLSYQVDSHEIIIGKLICLMELGRHREAQYLCEELLGQRDEHYYHYVHIYLTILFQTNQYGLLMEQVEDELQGEEIPPVLKEQFEQLYDMSTKMQNDLVIEDARTHLDEFYQAVESNDHGKQWRLIESLRKSNTVRPERLVEYLAEEQIHPVIKTAIFLWLKEEGSPNEVTIHKFERKMDVIPNEAAGIQGNGLAKQISLLINEIEQKDPSLYNLLNSLLYRYLYVRYPVVPPYEDALKVAEALRSVGLDYLNTHEETGIDASPIVEKYIEEIRLCDALYSSVIEE
ncbi:tetratricopeptide repeat protein [Virgibacillus xinjiangensis]|uniref:Tetratricopeptide repeat protein n=1 Tax=Virgibacillus xinjiangensis TaxID=393090 RepID=A0ABV7CUL7_9BACI